MDKQTLIPDGKSINVGVGRLSALAATRGAKVKAKTAGMEAVHGWDSSFHSERGCLSCEKSAGRAVTQTQR